MRIRSIVCILVIFSGGCYSLDKKYNYGESFHDSPDLWTEDNPQFEVGEPVWILDTLGNYVFSIPSKLLFLNSQVDNHEFDERTIEIMKAYIRRNNLRSVKVRFNQYAPISELKRIQENTSIHPLAKYTLGLGSWLIYTIFPERLFAGLIGGDHYNPYSNTISLYSNLPSIAIHEGAHAKDFNAREYKTIYAIVYSIPVLGPLYHEAVATDDTFAYFQENNDPTSIQESYEILVPAYSTYLGGAYGDIVQSPYSFLTIIPGHIYGQYKSRQFHKDRYGTETRIGEDHSSRRIAQGQN